MRIHCDRCGQEIEKDAALPHATDEGEVVYFCSAACFEERTYHETMHDPGAGEDAVDLR